MTTLMETALMKTILLLLILLLSSQGRRWHKRTQKIHRSCLSKDHDRIHEPDIDSQLYDKKMRFAELWHGIMLGTKWCGAGNISAKYNELGSYRYLDSCCREHDHCFESIPKYETKYGLTNNEWFTRSHCTCDRTFYNCMSNNITDAGLQERMMTGIVGYTYFTALAPSCFRKDYPCKACLKEEYRGGFRIRRHRCTEYSYNKRGRKVYQWFDNPLWHPFYGKSSKH